MSDSLPEPAFQPASVSPDNRFASSEIFWWSNGKWGEAGYAIPNDGGKPTTSNETVLGIHDFIGAELFNLMHRPDVKFSRPFNSHWLQDLVKMLDLGIKRMGDYSVSWTDDRDGDAEHTINTPQSFRIYPVPFFGGRVRQKDAKRWCGIILRLLSEIMQHSDNDFDDNATDFLTVKVQEQLLRVKRDLAMKYLGFPKAEVEDPGFIIPIDRFSAANYNPSANFTGREMVEERMPQMWWPEANDLTPIASGIAAPVAKQWATRWPDSGEAFYGDDGAFESAFPGSGDGSNIVSDPTK